ESEKQFNENKIHMEILNNKNKTLCETFLNLEGKNNKNKPEKLSQTENIPNGSKFYDLPIGCSICKNKILKNFTGFSIHFSRIHKDYCYEKRSQYCFELNEESIFSHEHKNIPNPITPKRPVGLFEKEESLITI
ncbi:hypothetical protein BpHYR1_017679, partial [Brachionus plicatilis]